MMKKLVLAVALLSLAISMGCRNVKGISKVNVVVSNSENLSVLFVTEVLQFTATVTGTSNTAVTWSLSSSGCTGSACGTLSPSGLYTAPPTSPGKDVSISIIATSAADSSVSGSFSVKVHQITVEITPNPINVGKGLTQQFTAVVLPDQAPQAVTWSIQNCTGSCGSGIDQTGLYSAVGATAGSTLSVQAAVPPSLDPSGFSSASVTIVNSRLIASSTYVFRFSGFNIAGATARVGNFVVAADGTSISSGVQDELTSGGPQARTITGGSASMDTNDQGTITLTSTGTGGSRSDRYTIVLDANADIQMTESDSNGTGSGVIEPFTGKFKDQTSLNGNFVLGFTGADVAGNRVGYAAVLPMTGAGCIGTTCGGTTPPGLIDINDGGAAVSASDVSGSYTMANGIGTMILTSATLNKTFNFNLYGVSGALKPSSPATLYAISTVDPLTTNPGVSGTVVFQDPNQTYNNGAFKFISVVSLTGTGTAGSNASLTLASTDGAGDLAGNFDQNNGGTILSVSSFGTGYTYLATGTIGRYTFKLLGNPTANPVVPPLTFVLYASGANQGFLLDIDPSDQTSKSVITGTMYLQLKNHFFSESEIPGAYAAVTTSSGTSGVCPIAANWLLTWGNPTKGVGGTQFENQNASQCTVPGSAPVTGAYTLQSSGTGTFTLTAPATTPNYAIYAIDVTHFLALDVTGTANGGTSNASILLAQQ